MKQDHQKKVNDLIRRVMEVESICLDETVFDLKSKEASAINNGGASEQIYYILKELGNEEGIKIVEEILNG